MCVQKILFLSPSHFVSHLFAGDNHVIIISHMIFQLFDLVFSPQVSQGVSPISEYNIASGKPLVNRQDVQGVISRK